MINGPTIYNSLTRANKKEIIGWNIPDYGSSVSISSNSEYTAPSDGIITATSNGSNTTAQVKSITDNLTLATCQGNGYFKVWAIVKKDLIYKPTGNQDCAFIPFKGVIND